MTRGERLIRLLPILFLLVVMGLFAYVAWAATGFMRGAGLFPYYIALAGLVIATIELIGRIARLARPDDARLGAVFDLGLSAEEQTAAGYGRALAQLGWVVAYLGLMWLLGGLVGSAAFVLAFLRLGYQVPWLQALAPALAVAALVYLLGIFLDLRWPRAALSAWLPLP